MAEENETAEEGEETTKSGGKSGLIIALVAILLAAGIGFAVYMFVLKPKLPDENTMPEEPVKPANTIPQDPKNHTFAMATVNLMREGDESAGILLYQISFECANERTVDFIMTYEPRFIDMVNNLHASRTRDEVDDILQFKLSIQRQIKQKANDMLDQMTPDDDEGDPPMVTGVFHNTCMANDGQ